MDGDRFGAVIGYERFAMTRPADVRAIRSEPSGATYRALLAFARDSSRTFSLSWRKQLRFDASASGITRELQPFLDRQHETDTWPGTTLVGHTAIVRFYRVCPDTLRILTAAERLYAWLAPGRPEDLAFYSPAGRWWLASIAHERESFVDVDAADFAALTAAVPGLEF